MLIVFIHAVFPGVFGQAVQAAARAAVPLFFAMSGYFLTDGAEPDKERIRERALRRLRKLIPVTAGVWSVYTAYACLIRAIGGGSPLTLLREKFTPSEILRFLLFNAGRVVYDPEYTYDHMWYLFAMIYVYLLVYLAAGRMAGIYRPLCLMLMAFLCAGCVLQMVRPVRIFGISIRTWYVLRNWLLEGIPFFLAGYWIRRSREAMDRERGLPGSAGACAAAAAAAFLLQPAEFMLTGVREIYFSSIIAVVFTVMAAARSGGIAIPFFEAAGRRLASHVYYWHVLIYSVFTRCFAFFYLRALPGMGERQLRFWNGVYPYFLPLLILGISLGAAQAAVCMRGKTERERRI